MSAPGDAADLFCQGRFADAARALRSGDNQALALEIRYFLGQAAHVKAEGRRLLQTKPLSNTSKARVLRVIGNQLRDEGLFAEALDRFRAAVTALAGEDVPRERAASLCLLLESECDSAAFGAARATALDARRAGLHSGDPVTLAATHHTFGRLEARVGHYERALRHFAMVRQCLADTPNVFLLAAVDSDESVTRAFLGELPRARALAESGLAQAQRSGWTKGIVAAASNCACVCVMLGLPREAEAFLQVAEAQPFENPSYALAILDTRAQIALATGDYASAASLLAADAPDADHVAPWCALACIETETRALIRQERWDEAIGRADEGLRLAARHDIGPYLRSLRLRRALALAGSGATLTATDVPTDTNWSDWSPAAQGAFWLVRALASRSLPLAASYARRARHIYSGAGDVNGVGDVQQVQAIRGAQPPQGDALDSAAALFDVASHPHILGPEAFALLEDSGCVAEAALIARGAQQVRVLQTRGWDVRDAALMARKTQGVETIDCGTHGEEALQIVARPPQDLERRGTWIAIRKLVAAALALERHRRDEQQRAALWPAESLDDDPDILWVSEPVNEVVRVGRRIASTDITVLLTGETGTGKEMLARTIHQASARAGQALLPFNCTAVPRDMLESQLFGYRRGAFTGADAGFSGVIRAAAGGTLFLDEIADMPLELQPKLLRFLETHEIHPLGEPHPVVVDVRVIAATNASLEQLVADGRFRQDLFYRLNVVRLRLPPLRERREEIPALVAHYVRRYGEQLKKGRLTIADEAIEYLLLHPWPGNLRQLANEVQRMVALADPDSRLDASHLSPEIRATRRTIPAPATPGSGLRVSLEQSLPEAVELLEKTMVQAALERSEGRVEEAARRLGISRKGLFLKRRRWGMQG